jgi:hypothetical protein
VCTKGLDHCYDARVAALSAPSARRSLAGKALAAAAARRRVPGRPNRLAAVAVVARQHLVTAAALASVDIGAFHAGPAAGWVVTGLSLLALDFAVTG